MKTILLSLFVALLPLIAEAQEMDSATDNNNDKVYQPSELDKQPEFPGGLKAFYNYVNTHFRIPNIKEDIVAKVYIAFFVEADGSMSNHKIAFDPGYGLGEEGLRVFKSVKKKWQPGIINGKPVRTSYKCPITITVRSH